MRIERIRLVLVAFLTAVLGLSPTFAQDIPIGKLPDLATPTAYRLDLTLDPDAARLKGQVSIDVDLKQSTQSLYLHGRELHVAKVTAEAGGKQVAGTYTEVHDSGVAQLRFDQPLPAGKAVLTLQFDAAVGEQLRGIYRVREGGQNYLFAQFEAVDARRSFPGFDEPRFKTPFDLTLTVKEGHKAVTNTPQVKEEKLPGGWKRLTFLRTKPLPTYLLTFAVGELDIVEHAAIPPSTVRPNAVPLRGVTTKGKGGQMKYALDNTAGIFGALESYFAVAYPYEKLDILAVPDFAAGAMENAGAITYREPLVLFGDNPPINQVRSYASVHAHEMAHQWFGDLVTPVWWDDIWLNEAFATWMAFKAVDAWRPELQYSRASLRAGLFTTGLDSLNSARRIRNPVADNNDISDAFDGITYQKGAAVLAMVESFMGPEKFRKGIQDHLQAHAHGVATGDQFFAAQAKAAGDDKIVTAFRSFVEQPGIPVVAMDWACGNGKVKIQLAQSRYAPLGSAIDPKATWVVPMVLGIGQQTHPVLLDKAKQTIELDAKTCPSFINPNVNGAGYYLTSLPQEKWQAVLATIDQQKIGDKLSLFTSLQRDFNAGRVDPTLVIDLASKMASSDSYEALQISTDLLTRLTNSLLDPVDRDAARARWAAMFRPTLDRIGLEDRANDTPDTQLQRTILVDFLANTARDTELRKQLLAKGQAYLGLNGATADPKALAPNLRQTALIVTAQDAPAAQTVPVLKAQMTRLDDPLARRDAVAALGAIVDPKARAELRDFAISPAVRSNEVLAILNGQQPEAAFDEGLWQWLQTNIDPLSKRLEQRVISRLSGNFFLCKPEDREKVKAFFQPLVNKVEGGPRSLANSMENADLCIAVKAKQGPAFRKAIKGGGS